MSKIVRLYWNGMDSGVVDSIDILRGDTSHFDTNSNSNRIATLSSDAVEYTDENVSQKYYYVIVGRKGGSTVTVSDYYLVDPENVNANDSGAACSCCKRVTRFFTNYKGKYYRFFNITPKIQIEYNLYFKLTYFHRFIGQDYAMEEGAWMRVDEIDATGTIIRTAYNKYIKSKQWMKEHAYLEPLKTTGHYYRGSIVTDGRHSSVEVDRVTVVKAGKNHPYIEDNNFARITSKGYLSALHLRTGMFGFEPYYADSLKGVYDTTTKLFTDDIDVPVYEHGGSEVKGKRISETHYTDYVTVGDPDAAAIGNCILYSENEFKPKITTIFYDENKSKIGEELHISHTNSVKANENVFLEWFAFKPHILPDYPNLEGFQNKRHGSIKEKYGYSSMPAINRVLGIPTNARYVRYKIERNGGSHYYMAFPCVDSIVPLAGQDGYISPVSFTFETPSFDDYLVGIGNIGEPSTPEPSPKAMIVLMGAGYDNVYDWDEINAGTPGSVTARVTLVGGTKSGDYLLVTDSSGNTLFDSEVYDNDIKNGIEVEVPVSFGDATVSATAVIKNDANVMYSDSDMKNIIQHTPSVEVELLGTGVDGVYDWDEINSGTPSHVTAKVTLDGGDTQVGDMLLITYSGGSSRRMMSFFSNGNSILFDRALTSDDIFNGVSVEVPVTYGDNSVTVTAEATNDINNTDVASATKSILPPTPYVSIDLTGAGEDGVFDWDEINTDTRNSVTAYVMLDGGFTSAGDLLIVTDENGVEIYNAGVTESQIINGLEVEVPVEASDTSIAVNAEITNTLGLNSTDSDTKEILKHYPSVSVELVGTGADDIFDWAEINAGKTESVVAKITLDGDTKVGDTLSVRGKDEIINRSITSSDILNGVSVDVPVAKGDTSVSVIAKVTNVINESVSDSDTKDIVSPEPAIAITLLGAGSDNMFDWDEIDTSGNPFFVNALVEFDTQVSEVGDTLTVRDITDAQYITDIVVDFPITQDHINNGLTVEVPIAISKTKIKVRAETLNAYNVTSVDTDSKKIIRHVPSVNVSFEGMGTDDVFDWDEINSGTMGSVTANITLDGGDTRVDDVLLVKGLSGTTLMNRSITSSDIANGVSVEVPLEKGDTVATVTATVTNFINESVSDSDSKTIMSPKPFVDITLLGAGNDDKYHWGEIHTTSMPYSVEALVTLNGGDTEVGDLLTIEDTAITNGYVMIVENHVITAGDISNGFIMTIPVSATAEKISVRAKVVNAYNQIEYDSDEKIIIMHYPAVSVELLGAGSDNQYDWTEINTGNNSSVEARIILTGGETSTGDVLKVYGQRSEVLFDRAVTNADITNGITVQVPLMKGDATARVSANIRNFINESASDSDSKPIISPIPGVAITLMGAGSDDTYEWTEIDTSGTPYKVIANVELDSAETMVGDLLTVVDRSNTQSQITLMEDYVITSSDITNGVNVEVPVGILSEKIAVRAKVSNEYNQTANDYDSKNIIRHVPSIVVKLLGYGTDDKFDWDEINAGTTSSITATITLDGGNTRVGDDLYVSGIRSSDILVDRKVTSGDISNGITVEVPVVKGDSTARISGRVTNFINSTDTSSDSKTIVSPKPEINIELLGAGDDGRYDWYEIEAGSPDMVDAHVSFSGGSKVGDTIEIIDRSNRDNDNHVIENVLMEERLVTQQDIDNGITIDVPVLFSNGRVSVKATSKNDYMQTVHDYDSKSIDIHTPSVSVVLTGMNNGDKFDWEGIDETQARYATAIVSFDAETKVGDTLRVTDGRNNVLVDREITSSELTDGVNVSVPILTDYTSVAVYVRVTNVINQYDTDSDSKEVLLPPFNRIMLAAMQIK